jgi:hypothetical protein
MIITNTDAILRFLNFKTINLKRFSTKFIPRLQMLELVAFLGNRLITGKEFLLEALKSVVI